MIGQTISHYRIKEKIGEGGMGVVYLAEDTHLGRRVAIKFLAAAHDHHYRDRFLREARAISTLSHPNIAIVHDYGETTEGQPFIVMEYVKGETLSELLHQSALTISRALEIIEAVAEALGAAHAQGIIHRDIKPSNVLVDEAGQVKLFDFGLVKQLYGKPLEGVSPDANTLLGVRTSSNVVVGTPLYLSPEQATGVSVDARSDLFALGTLFYECLTGKPAFSGGNVIEIGAQIIHFNPPPPSSVNKRVTPELDRITLKALAKKPDRRYQSAREMAGDLRAALMGLTDKSGHRTQRIEPARLRHSSALRSISDTLRRPRLSIGFFLFALIIVVFGAWNVFQWARTKQALPFQTMRMNRLTNSGKTVDAAISPDGKYFAEVLDEGGLQSLWLRQVGVPVASKQIVAPTASQYEGLTFSPDRNSIYYVVWENNAQSVLYKVAVLGSAPQRLLVDLDSPIDFSADGNRIAFIRRDTNRGESALMIANADGTLEQTVAKRREPLFFSEVSPAWSNDGTVIACSVRSTVGGSNDLNSYVGLSLSEDSSKLVTVESERLSSIWIAPKGEAASALQVTSGVSKHYGVSWTTDGRIVYSSIASGNPDIWIMSAEGTNAKQLTLDPHVDRDPSASPDGRFIVFASDRAGRFNIWRMDLDGTNPKQLTNGDDEEFPQVSPDLEWVVYQGFVKGVPTLWRVPLAGGNAVQVTDKYSNWPAISPDGKSIACSYLEESAASWKLAIFPFAGGAPIRSFDIPLPYLQHFVWQRIRWTADGRALTYIDRRDGISNIWSQQIAAGPPKQLTDFKEDQIFNFAWSHDGAQLACVRGVVTSDAVLITDFK